MNVLIVGRTKMSGGGRCIGGLTEDGRSVRLLSGDGGHWGNRVGFQVGEEWEVEYHPSPNVIAPHVEDVIVDTFDYLRDVPDLRAHILKIVAPWTGPIRNIFVHKIRYTGKNNGYIAKRIGVPAQSTGFWVPDRDLRLRDDGKHYDYAQWGRPRGLSYVGEPAPMALIAAGSLVRVSLARWWRHPDADPDFEERCYLQLSGWYD